MDRRVMLELLEEQNELLLTGVVYLTCFHYSHATRMR